jgi:hypothetical protein
VFEILHPEGNLAEWAAEFRADIAAFLADADIDACVDTDRPLELPPRGNITYHAFACKRNKSFEDFRGSSPI